MAQDEQESTIIIKKIKKGGHGGHHGGSWKVAYADFVTAMMAFFLMMWLLNSTSSKQKEELAGYFQNYSILDKEYINKPSPGPATSEKPPTSGDVFENTEHSKTEGVESSLDMAEAVKQEVAAIKEREEMAKKTKQEAESQKTGEVKVVTVEKEFAGNSEMANKIKSEIESKLVDIKDQIIVEPYRNFVKIEIIDNTGNPIFDVGSVEPTSEARKILKVIADSIRSLETKIAIEGHTDARMYPSQIYTNWELSTGRASAARVILGESGVSSSRLLSVSGLADTTPRIKEDPFSPLNRRISILLYPKGKTPQK